MKIFHTITRFVRGGADENTLYSCNLQAEDGHEVMLAYGRENHSGILDQLHPAVHKVEIGSMVRAISPIDDLRALSEMTELVRKFAPDVVHTHTSKAGLLGRIAGKRVGVPAIIHGVHILPFIGTGAAQAFVFRGIERWIAKDTDYFIDVSEGMKAASIENGVGSEENHIVIPSGMKVAKFTEAEPFTPEQVAEELGLESPPAKLIVSAAVLEPRKRHVEFLDALAKVVERVPGVHFAVTGAGPLADAVMNRARALQIADRVHLLGFRTDVERWMATADVCTLASEREGLPRTVIQYVMCGKPVVATDLPGIDAVLEHGVNGYVAPTPVAMAEPLIALLSDDALREKFAAASRAKDLSPWDARAMVDGIARVYDDVLAKRGSDRR